MRWGDASVAADAGLCGLADLESGHRP